MEEMVEPDRTILIVSIIGLVVIWGSVAYHKFVQGSPSAAPEAQAPQTGPVEEAAPSPATPAPSPGGGKGRRKGKGR